MLYWFILYNIVMRYYLPFLLIIYYQATEYDYELVWFDYSNYDQTISVIEPEPHIEYQEDIESLTYDDIVNQWKKFQNENSEQYAINKEYKF